METRLGVNGTLCDDVFFTESNITGIAPIRKIHVEISRQNSNLFEVKKQMAGEAKSIGANAVMNFKYGQKKHKTWELVLTFKWDTESWHGEGDAIKI